MANLGKYEILEQLGTGSMGTVYRARDTVIDRFVALKTIRTGAGIETEIRERFYREAKSCGRLQHQNIVTIYDLGESDRTAYIAMELLEGADFRKVVEERRAASLPTKLEWMIQICEALGHAHRHAVIHRDVKPSNLFLTNSNLVKVLDFGIARLPSSRLTVAGKILGTPNYMAPEQILAKPCDGRADLFSAGVVFFELLVYQHPFRGTMVPQRIVENEPDSLFDHDSNLPVILEKIFTHALAKDPERRYPTGAAFAADLRMILDALRQNSSPTFSRIVLPSERGAVETEVPIAVNSPVEPAKAPEGEDSAEWRYSEVLGLIPLFESALQRNDANDASRHFESLRRVTAGDARFNEAVTGCRVRLEQMSSAAGMEPLPAPPGGQTSTIPTSPKVCAQCGTGNRAVARFCIECGANLEDQAFEEGQGNSGDGANGPERRDRETIFDRTVVENPRTPSVPQEGIRTGTMESAVVAAPQVGAERGKRWVRAHPQVAIGSAAVLVVAIAAAILVPILSARSYKIEPAVATAQASAATVEVHESANAGSRVLYPVGKGKPVNVLTLPDSHWQAWVKVQAVSGGKAKRAGFAPTAQLSGWKGRDAVSAFAILWLSAPLEPGTDAESKNQIAALGKFAAEYPGTAQASQALAEQAKLRLTMIKRHQASGLDAEALRAELATAIEETAKAGDGAGGAKEELIAMRGAVEVVPDPSPTVVPVPSLARVQKAFDEGRLEDARNLVWRILKAQPLNKAADSWRKKIDNAISMERQ